MGSRDQFLSRRIRTPVAFVDIVSPKTGHCDKFTAHGRCDSHENHPIISRFPARMMYKRVATAPPGPRRVTAAYGNTRPAETSPSGILFGYVGKAGLFSRASVAK